MLVITFCYLLSNFTKRMLNSAIPSKRFFSESISVSFPQPSVSGTDTVHRALELKIRIITTKFKIREKILNIFSLRHTSMYVFI